MSDSSSSFRRHREGRHHQTASSSTRSLFRTCCDELAIYPNQFYGWLQGFFENGHVASTTAASPKPLRRQGPQDRAAPSQAATQGLRPRRSSWKSTSAKKKVLGRVSRSVGAPQTPATPSSILSRLERQDGDPVCRFLLLDRHRH